MIAVLADPSDSAVVEEFFELFKTPWEFYRPGKRYEVLVCSGPHCRDDARLVIIYGSGTNSFDRKNRLQAQSALDQAVLSFRGEEIAIYGKCATFGASGDRTLTEVSTGECAAVTIETREGRCVRVGYDLFEQVRHLLTRGQPVANAAIPALELHIARLRAWILEAGAPLVEVVPTPAGHRFMTCLSHDVDHVGIRNHKFDHTLLGFLYRATLGSLLNVLKGRFTLKQLGINWAAVLRLPFIHLGWARDFWYQFENYVKLEQELPSTFFVVPFKGDPGRDVNGTKPRMRATSYDISDIGPEVAKLRAGGREVSLHGIDAWLDRSRGQVEMARVATAEQGTPGVRMHWLCFDERSPETLEQAGFAYDSTVGYNETIGFRAGTLQAYRPLKTKKLLELPMHIMDTALFYPAHRNLAPEDAKREVSAVVARAERFGGALTVNWHDRSIAPERLWDGFYIWLIAQLRSRNAWFGTCSQAVRWFGRRREVRFEEVTNPAGECTVRLRSHGGRIEPALTIRIHAGGRQEPKDMAWDGVEELSIAGLAGFQDLDLCAGGGTTLSK